MAATTTELLSWDAFEKIPEDGLHREVLEGELVVLPPPKSRHTLIADNTAEALRPVKEQRLGKVLIEAGYKLSSHPPTWIQPDISVLTAERVSTLTQDGYFHGGPQLAVEVVSPSETARDLNRKIDLLLAAGTLAVWVIYPDDEEVRVFLPGGDSYARGTGGVLTDPEVFGQLEILRIPHPHSKPPPSPRSPNKAPHPITSSQPPITPTPPTTYPQDPGSTPHPAS